MGCPAPLQPDEPPISTPGGTRTRSFRVEGPASSPLRPRGHESSGGRTRTRLSRLTVARLTDSTTPEQRAEAAGLEPANGSHRLRGSNALPFRLGHASASGRRGTRTPKARRPTRFRDGNTAPVAVLPSSGPGRRRTCNPPLKRRQLCQLSYGAVSVTGRDRTCDAPRFRRALYRAELRSRAMGGAGVEPAASSVSERRSAP